VSHEAERMNGSGDHGWLPVVVVLVVAASLSGSFVRSRGASVFCRVLSNQQS